MRALHLQMRVTVLWVLLLLPVWALPVLVRPQSCVVPASQWVPHCGNATTYAVRVPALAGSSSETYLRRADALAQQWTQALQELLQRFNCRDFYPYYSCQPCLEAYQQWACVTLFPKCLGNVDPSSVDPPCLAMCTEVMRVCPTQVEFQCPVSSAEYSTNLETCNSFGRALNSAGSLVPLPPLTLLLSLLVLLLLVGP